MPQRCPEGAAPSSPCPSSCALLFPAHSGTSSPPEPRLQWRFIIWMLRDGRGQQFPLPRGQPHCKSWNTHPHSATAARGGGGVMGFSGPFPAFPGLESASPASVYINSGLQLGKLRPRAAKDLLHTSKSKLLGHRAGTGMENLSWTKFWSMSWTRGVIFLATAANLSSPDPGSRMCPS